MLFLLLFSETLTDGSVIIIGGDNLGGYVNDGKSNASTSLQV